MFWISEIQKNISGNIFYTGTWQASAYFPEENDASQDADMLLEKQEESNLKSHLKREQDLTKKKVAYRIRFPLFSLSI